MVEVNTLEVAGFAPVMGAMRLPKDSVGDTDENTMIGPNDLALAQKLVMAGDEHAKCIRGIQVWFKIAMPMYFMIEFDTYRIGIDTLSTSSTMHGELKGLRGEELQKAKGDIPGSKQYTRICVANYQTLRRMYFQRKYHRLPEWREFCRWIESLPLARELITLNEDLIALK